MKQPHREPENQFFRAWATVVLRHRLVLTLLVVAFAAAAVFMIKTRSTTDMTVESFLESDSDALGTLEEFRDKFGRDDVFLVLVEGDVFSMPFMLKLKRLHQELAELNLPLKSLGQRLNERRRGKGAVKAGGAARPEAKAPTKAVVKGGAPGDNAGDDDFGDFEDDTPSSAGAAKVQHAAGWGDERGGTIVDEIVSLINMRRTRGRTIARADGSAGVELVVGELMKPWPAEAALPAMRAEVLADRSLVGQVVGRAGRHTVIMVRCQFMDEADTFRVNDHIMAILSRYNAADFQTHMAGITTMASTLQQTMFSEMRRLFAFALIGLVLVLAVLFRHPLGVIGPLAVVLLAIISTFAFMALFGIPLTMLSNILPAFIICVGVGNTVHIISVYRDNRRRGRQNTEAIVSAVGATGVPVLFTSMTTAVGLLSFQFATIDAIGDMGLAGAVGVGSALLMTLVVVPVFLSLNKRSMMGAQQEGQQGLIDRFLNFCSAISGRRFDAPLHIPPVARRRRGTLVAALVLSLLALAGMSQLRVWHNPLSWISDDQPIKTAFDVMDRHVGGTATVQLLIRTRGERGIKDLELLQGLERLIKYIHAFRHPDFKASVVGNAVSLLDVVKETNRALHGGDQAHYRLPQTQRALADTLFMFENAGPEQLRRLATADLKTTQMTVRVRWMEATSYGPLTKYIDQGIAKHLGDRARVSTTGTAYTMFMTVSSLISNLLRSFSVALAVIALIMVILLRNLRLGLIAMVPNLLPILYIMGFMGFTGIPIDMANLLIASIAIGLAVDDTIHFLHHYKVHYDENGDVEAAIAYSFRHSGRAMVGTTMVLSIGFFVVLAAEMVNLQRFGGLIGATVIFALLIDLIFAPALLRTFYTQRPPSPREGEDASRQES